MKLILRLLVVLCPWGLRRWILTQFFGYEIHPNSHIGLAWVFPKKLVMEEGSSIGTLTVCKGIDLLHLHSHSLIGRMNWITGFPSDSESKHFAAEKERSPQLILGSHAAITNRHLIDCTNSIMIGEFTTIAGFQSQFLTHAINLEVNQQQSQPIEIGHYCFVGTACVCLPGSRLPDYSVLGASSLLNKSYSDPYYLYAGVPARPLKELPPEMAYFNRKEGFVY
jgi:serine acetyltransferase